MKTCFDYAKILYTLQRIAPEAHIAGGAVRDTILKKPIQDIDIFMRDVNLEEAAAKLRSDHGFVKVGEWAQYLQFSDPSMTRVAKFEKADETIPICIIGLCHEYAEEGCNIGRFDFAICMAAFDGEQITRTEAFDRDVEAKTFTLCRTDNYNQFSYSLTRFKRITAARYAGWTLNVPEKFEAFAKEHAFRRDWYPDNFVKGFEGEMVLKPKERPAATH